MDFLSSALQLLKAPLLAIVITGMVISPVSMISFPAHATESVTDPSINETPEELKGIGIEEKLGNQVSLEALKFKNEAGETVPLSHYFKSGKPVILSLIYYECPNLCNFLLNGFVDTLKEFQWTPGNQFEFVSVSIDPRETPDLALAKKQSYLELYGRPDAEKGWHFLTGEKEAIRKLSSEVGFGFRWDEKSKQYAHSAALFVLTPEGKISRYLYGIQFKERDVRLALVEASNGKIGSVVDRIMLYCFRYDPVNRKYSIYLTKLMQAGSAGTVLLFGGYLVLFWRGQRKAQRETLSQTKMNHDRQGG